MSDCKQDFDGNEQILVGYCPKTDCYSKLYFTVTM